jgi:hypothetical protein
MLTSVNSFYMSRTSSLSDNLLVIHSEPGLEHYEIEEGRFEVRYANETKHFDRIVGAVLFYYHLKENASIWNITGIPELIESKVVVPLNQKLA